MADFGSPVASGVNVDPLSKLSEIAGLRLKQQALQTGQYQQQSAQANAQQEQQTASQRAGIAGFMSNLDVTKHVGSDGTLDLDEILTDPKLRQAAGDNFPAVMDQLLKVKSAQIGAKKQLADLNGTLRDQFSSTVGSLRTDPDVVKDNPAGRQKVQQALGDFAESGGPDAARIAGIYGPVAMHVGQGKLSQALSTFQLQAMDAATQAGRQAPVLTNTGGQQVNINPQAAGGNLGGTPPLTNTLPPSADIVTDAYGRQFRFNRQTNQVEPVGTGSAPAGGAPGGTASGGGGFQQPVAGQPQVLHDVESARAVGDQAPAVRNVNSQLLKLSQETSTGPGSQTPQKIAAFLGMPSGSNYQEINAYLDRQSAMQARAMGVPNTNAGLAASQSATGTTEYTPKALQEKVKFADALNSGTIAYRQGLDKSVGTGPTPDLSKYQAFRGAWSQNFDPDIFRAEDAQRRGDNAELESIRKRLGPQGMKTLAQKSANLRQLENGQIPQ